MFSLPANRHVSHPQRRTALKVCASGMLLGALGLAPTVWAQPMALSTTINRAGRLRALSQRIAKAYAQLVLGVTPEQSREVMTTALRIAKTHLGELSRAGLPAEAASLLALCTADADHLAEVVASTVSMARMADVNKTADQLLANAERLTATLEGTGKPGAKIINIAGRQRMLSQRMAKSFMLIEAGLDTPVLRKQLEVARAEFVQGMDTLEAAPVSTTAIKQNLVLARTQWMFYQSALELKNQGNARRDVATTSERILEIMETLTGQYDNALKELLGSVAYHDTKFAALSQS